MCRPSWIWRLHPLGGGRDYRLSIRCRCPWHSMHRWFSSLGYRYMDGGIFFFFFVHSRLARGCLLLYFILFGMLGDWKGIEFLVGAFFETWNYSACYFFFLFFSKIHFFYPYIALDILMKSIIVELILCLNIYVIKFFFSFVFFFSFLSVYAIY